MKRIIYICLLQSFVVLIQAQNIVMQSFCLDENDLTAQNEGSFVLDQNGKKCALIKVETTQTGFSFDVGGLGVRETQQKEGEIWVYAPQGVKRITISHQQFGVLRDCDLGLMLKSGKTYNMKLITGEVQTVVRQANSPDLGEADIYSSPAMADIFIDGKNVGQTPQHIDQLPIGEHHVRLSKKGFQDYSATFNVKANEATELSATLNSSYKVITVDNVSFTMILVDGGTFTMGATSEQGSDAADDEKPAHQVTLSSYYIGETEVTQELWQAVMGNNPSKYKRDSRPVEQVSWDDCQNFIENLNKKTGLKFRFPTEAEWEYAARGGNKSQGYKYSGSNNIDDVAWYNDNSGSSTHDVKTKQANELGLYDMSGNVEEWCSDWYSDYSRVVRGGNWCYGNANDCRVSSRDESSLRWGENCLGLRLAL